MSAGGDLSAALTLRRGVAARVGLERVALVEAVAELGSISAAAGKLGMSYRGGGKTLVATITLESAKSLGIAVGEPIIALIKAPHVILAVE